MCEIWVVWGVFLRSRSVILFYFLTLQAAGRMTWLPGKLLGRCTGLLPASQLQKRLPPAKHHSPRPGCPPPRQATGGRDRSSSKPRTCCSCTRGRGNAGLLSSGESAARGPGRGQPSPASKDGFVQCLVETLFLLFFYF